SEVGSNLATSIDGGAHWVNTGASTLNGWVNVLVIDPRMPVTLYAETETGCCVSYRFLATSSGGAGADWTFWTGNNTALMALDYVTALAIDPVVPATVYVGTASGGVFKSTDAGAHWAAVNAGLTTLNVTALAFDPAGTSMYAATSDGAL